MAEYIVNMGKYSAITMKPMSNPKTYVRIGSIMDSALVDSRSVSDSK